jgi:tetratricopeptide (TPR) repeat protein
MLRTAPEMATCSKCGFVMDERTRPPKCPRCATPTQSTAGPFAPPGGSRPAPGGRPSPRNLEPVGAPPVFGGAMPATGTSSGQTLYGLPVTDDDELTMLADDNDPLGEPNAPLGPSGPSESSGDFDTADLFESTNYGEVDLSQRSEDALELDLLGLTAQDRAAASRPTSRELPELVDDDDLPMPSPTAGNDETTRRTVSIPTAQPQSFIPPPAAGRPTPQPAPGRQTLQSTPRPAATIPNVVPPSAAPPARPTGPPSHAPARPAPLPPRRTSPPGGDPPSDLPAPARASSGNEGFGSQANLPTPARASNTGFGNPTVDLPTPARPGTTSPGFSRGGGPPPSPPAYGGPGGPLPRTIETPPAPGARTPANAPRTPGFDDEMISVADLDLPSPIDLDLPTPAPSPMGVDFPSAAISHDNLPTPAGVDLLTPATFEVEPAGILPTPVSLEVEPARHELEPARAEVRPARGPNVPVPRALATNVAGTSSLPPPSTAYDPIGARRSPTPRDVGGDANHRPLILAALGLALLGAAAGGLWFAGVFEPPLDDVQPQSLGKKPATDTNAVQPAEVAAERNADVLAALARHTPKAYVEAIALAEAAGDRVGQAEAALRLHVRYGPDAVRRGQAEAWVETYAAQPQPFVQRVLGLAALARNDLEKAETLLVGDDPLTRLYRGWLHMAQGRAPEAAVEADAVLVASPGDVAALALRHEAKAEIDAAGELAGIEASLGKHPGHPGITLVGIKSAIAAGQLAKARKWLDGLGTPEGTGQGYAARILQVRGALDEAAGAPSKAALRYAEALAFAPEDTTLGPARVRALLKAKRLGEASSDAAAIVKARPKDVEAALLQAEVAVEGGEGDQALTLLQAIEASTPGRAETPYLIGLVHAMRLEVDLGKKAFATALERDPKLDRARIAEARMLAASGRIAEGITTIDGARKIASERPGGAPAAQAEILRAKAAMLKKAGQTAAALVALDQALEVAPTDNEAQLARGLLRIELGQLAEGKADLLALYERTGNYAGLTAPLGRIFVREDAITELEQLVGGVLEEPEATNEELVVGARLRLAQGKPEEAKALAERVLALSANDAEAQLLLAEALLESGDHVGALAAIDRSVPATPSAERHLWRGKILEFNGRHAEARPDYLKALQLDPELHEARFLYGRLLSAAGEAKAAEEELEKVVKVTDKWPSAWLALGRAQSELDAKDKAAANLQKALDKDESLHEAHLLLGRIYFGSDQYAKAEASFERATADEGNKDLAWYAEALYWLGVTLEKNGKKTQAKTAYERFLAVAPAKHSSRKNAEKQLAKLK